MRRLLATFVAVLVLGICVACNGVTLFVNNPSQFSGFVSLVQLSVVDNGSGAEVTVTVVTLIGNGTSVTQDFCGNVVSQFPLNTSVTGNFTPGSPCGTLISVTIAG